MELWKIIKVKLRYWNLKNVFSGCQLKTLLYDEHFHSKHISIDLLFLLFCLFGVNRPTRKFFTHMETSPLPVKGCKFWSMHDTHSYWAVGFFSVPLLLWHRTSVYNWSSPRTRDTQTYRRAFCTGAVTTCFYDLALSRLGFEHQTFRLRCETLKPTAAPPR